MEEFACNICGRDAYQVIYEKQVAHPLWWRNGAATINLRYVGCQGCGYVTLFPRLTFAEYEANYRCVPGLDRDALAQGRKVMLAERKEFLQRYAGAIEPDTIVEVGPAYGDFLMLFPEFKKRVGIEPSETYCAQVASGGLPLDYRACMLEEVPAIAPDLVRAADLLTACHVLEHAENPRTFVRQAVELVKPGGYVFIEVPSVEAMSDCQDPIFQTVHFGHVSQFSIPVLNRLCTTEGLQPVKVVFTAAHDYPVIRALYQRGPGAEDIANLFRNHCGYIDRNATIAKQALLNKLHSEEINQMLIWGCGQDLFDILDLLDARGVSLLRKKGRLVDRNKGKHGKIVHGLEIEDPASAEGGSIDAVAIPSRSELIQADIIKDARESAPAAEIITLYPLREPPRCPDETPDF